MLTFREGWRSFKEGLDRRFLLEYWRAVWNHAWEIFWGAGVIGVAFTIYTLYFSPPWTLLGWAVALGFLIAGYAAWRSDHVRLIPKLRVKETHFMETPITYNNQVIDHRTFIQLLPMCLTEAPVYECVAFLQRVEKLTADDRWEEVGIDRGLILNWEKVQHPQAEQALNIFFIQHKSNQVVLCLTEKADIPWHKFASIFGQPDVTEFRFYVQLTYSDKNGGDSLKPVRVCLDVDFANDRTHPTLNLKELDE